MGRSHYFFGASKGQADVVTRCRGLKFVRMAQHEREELRTDIRTIFRTKIRNNQEIIHQPTMQEVRWQRNPTSAGESLAVVHVRVLGEDNKYNNDNRDRG